MKGIPGLIKSLAAKAPVLKATMFCGAFTGRIKPKQITYCKITVMPTTFRAQCSEAPCKTEIIIVRFFQDNGKGLVYFF